MMWRRRRTVREGVFVAFAVFTFLIVGSSLYWLADGRPGLPEDFRRQVAEAGLEVVWSNSGPRGGSGVVETTCGPVVVTVNEVDDSLWVGWDDRRAELSRETVEALVSCAPEDAVSPAPTS